MEKSSSKTNNDDEGAAAAAGGATSSNPSSSEEQQAGNSPSSSDFQITLNDFFEFLKLSCHVNDMITNADNKSHIREPVPPAESAAGISLKRNLQKDVFDFNTLAENPLVNGLLGLKLSHRVSSSRDNSSSQSNLLLTDHKSSTHRNTRNPHTARGLHPKLNEQLDYVINEGVLDSVLSFICPLPLPSSLSANTARNKAGKPTKLPENPVATTAAATASPAASKSTANSSPRDSPPRDSDEGNGMVRVKDASLKGAPNATRRKSLLLARDCKQTRQDKKEWVEK